MQIFKLLRQVLPALLLGAPCLVVAQSVTDACTYTLHGRVFDGEHHETLPAAGILIKDLATGAISNSEGEYSIKNLCAGNYKIVCQYAGYESREIEIQINKNTYLDFLLFHKTTHLETVVVTGQAKNHDTSTPFVTKSGTALEEKKGSTFSDLLSNITGVNQLSTGATVTKPVIHGMHSQRIAVYNNSVKQEEQQWGAEHGNNIDPFAIGEVTVIKGAASVRYGADAVAGVILTEPAAIKSSTGIAGNVYVVGNSNGRQAATSVQLEGRPAKYAGLGLRAQLSGKKGGDLKAPHYFLTNTGTKELNGSFIANWETSKSISKLYFSTYNTTLGIYAGSHIGNLTDLQNVLLNGQPIIDLPFRYKIKAPSQNVHHHLLRLQNRFQLYNAGKITLQYSFQFNNRKEFDVHLGDNGKPANPDFSIYLATHSTEAILDHKLTQKTNGTIGITTTFQQNDVGGRRYLVPAYISGSAGLFLIERLVLDKWVWEAGIRAEAKHQIIDGKRQNQQQLPDKIQNFNQLSGTIGAQYAFAHHWQLQVNAGTGWRPPSINEQFSYGLHHGAASFEIGNQHLKTEKTYALSTSLNFTYGQYSASVQPYVHYFKGYIFARPLPNPILTVKGAFPAFEYQQQDAVFTGLDFEANTPLQNNVLVNTTASIIYAQSLDTSMSLPNIPPAQFGQQFQKKLKTNNLPETTFSLGYMAVAKQTHYTAGSDILPPPKTYFLVNAAAETQLSFKNHDFWLQISATNLLNTTYRSYLNRFRYYADDLGRNFTLRLKIPITST